MHIRLTCGSSQRIAEQDRIEWATIAVVGNLPSQGGVAHEVLRPLRMPQLRLEWREHWVGDHPIPTNYWLLRDVAGIVFRYVLMSHTFGTS